MLNVNRCSRVAFPGETIMQEAKLCTERYLRNALEDVGAFDKWALKKNIRGEVYNIFGFFCSFVSKFHINEDIELSGLKALYDKRD